LETPEEPTIFQFPYKKGENRNTNNFNYLISNALNNAKYSKPKTGRNQLTTTNTTGAEDFFYIHIYRKYVDFILKRKTTKIQNEKICKTQIHFIYIFIYRYIYIYT